MVIRGVCVHCCSSSKDSSRVVTRTRAKSTLLTIVSTLPKCNDARRTKCSERTRQDSYSARSGAPSRNDSPNSAISEGRMSLKMELVVPVELSNPSAASQNSLSQDSSARRSDETSTRRGATWRSATAMLAGSLLVRSLDAAAIAGGLMLVGGDILIVKRIWNQAPGAGNFLLAGEPHEIHKARASFRLP